MTTPKFQEPTQRIRDVVHQALLNRLKGQFANDVEDVALERLDSCWDGGVREECERAVQALIASLQTRTFIVLAQDNTAQAHFVQPEAPELTAHQCPTLEALVLELEPDLADNDAPGDAKIDYVQLFLDQQECDPSVYYIIKELVGGELVDPFQTR